MEQKTVEAMRKAFTVSVAAFDAVHTISGVFAMNKPPKTLMHKLHILTLNELSSPDPDFEQLDKYLQAMEGLAELNFHEQKAKENEEKNKV